MILQKTINRSLYLSGGFIILALTGVFGSFGELFVIEDVFDMGTLLLIVMIGGTGFYLASIVHERGLATMIANSAVGSLIVGLALSLLSLIVYVVSVDDGGERLVDVRQWVTFTFPNLSEEMFSLLTFGQGFMPGLLIFLGVAAVAGVIAALVFSLPNMIRGTLLSALTLTAVLGMMQSQLIRIIPITDALVLVAALLPGYLISLMLPRMSIYVRAAIGALIGAAVGGIAATFVNNGAITPNQISILLTLEPLPMWLVGVGALLGVMGAFAAVSMPTLNSGVLYFGAALVIVGLMNWQGGMTLLAAVITFVVLVTLNFLMPLLTSRSTQHHEQMAVPQRRISRQGLFLLGLVVAFIAPTFLGRSLTFALSLVGMYIIMGIGLNIVVGFAGLLDLGHVGFFAIGAYTIGLLTSPTILTCGGIPASEVLVRDVAAVREAQPDLAMSVETGESLFIEGEDGLLQPLNCNIWNFWAALPVAVFMAGASGMILGVPVLRLRGDYLAIVTLGLSEIISIIIGASTFKDVFGSAQGISPIPSPVIGNFEFFSADIYYLLVPGILLAVFISQRLMNSRVGRAWRSMRADEDVAEAMGIDLVRAKLSAFGISAAFAGLGGAFFGAGLQGAFPNSFTLLVSINVLSMIIIGGLGSIPGVIVGALVLVGLPEILRELDDYRLLVFGMLLVIMMLLKPEGLIPPTVNKLSEKASNTSPQKPSSAPATGD